MRSLNHFYAARGHGVAVARDHEPLKGGIRGPAGLHCSGHRRSGLAGTDDERTTARGRWNVRPHDRHRVCRLDRYTEALFQQLARRHGFDSMSDNTRSCSWPPGSASSSRIEK